MKKLVIIVVMLVVMMFGVKTFLGQCTSKTTMETLNSDIHFVDAGGTLISEYEVKP